MTSIEREVISRAAALSSRLNYLKHAKRLGYSDEFYTPRSITAALGSFDLDPCAGPNTQHARRNIRQPRDGLRERWRGRVWMNPPYSNIYEWLERFVAHANGIALVNARCETGWFQRLALGSHAVLFPKGRINFYRPGMNLGHPPCGSALIAYGERNRVAMLRSGIIGLVLLNDFSWS